MTLKLHLTSRADALDKCRANPDSVLDEIERLHAMIRSAKDTATMWLWDEEIEPNKFYRGADRAARAIAKELGA